MKLNCALVTMAFICLLDAGCGRPGATEDSGTSSESGNADESESGTCPDGELDCACYGNGTCNPGLDCIAGVCAEHVCPDGSESCPCYGNGTCDDGLQCSEGVCTPATGDGDGDSGDGDGDGDSGDGDGDGACGDGVTQMPEECDDGNGVNTDDCLDTCLAASCGDGFVWMGNEECDDGNDVNTDDCIDGCVAASCGDGFVQMGAEECDDGNMADDDACQNDCIVPGAVLAWSGQFTQGQDGGAHCGSYNNYRTSIVNSGQTFTQIQLRGSADMVGKTCAGAEADVICNALGNGTPLTLDCGGITWRVGPSGNGLEINAANVGFAQCEDPGWVVRPCIGNMNWGGMNTATCNGPMQTLEIRCSY